MKWMVNGQPADLKADQTIEIKPLNDRLVVRSATGIHTAVSLRSGGKVLVSYRGRTYTVSRGGQDARGGHPASTGSFAAPMPGVVVDVLVQFGDKVSKGQKLLVLEAMKTQQPVNAPFDGTIEALAVKTGEQVVEGQPLITVKPEEE